jgi:hypothetical protein
VKLTSYGLTGVTAVLVTAFCFACGDELPRTREKSSRDLLNKVDVSDSPLVETSGSSRDDQAFRG